MAGAHSGAIKLSCHECPEVIRTAFGCENPTQAPVWEFDDFEFYNCPISFITPEITEWFLEYKYVKAGIVQALRYEERQARWYDAVELYEGYLEAFMTAKNKKVKVKNG